MHNFGRGMWRRISDHEKHQQATNVQTNRLTHYLQTQKQRAIDAYSRIAISNEKKEVKEKVVTTDVTDNYVFVEAVISEAELVVSEAEVVFNEESEAVVTEPEATVTEAEPVVTEAEPVVTEAEPVVTEAEPVVSEAEPVVSEPEPVVSEPEPVISEVEPSVSEVPVVTETIIAPVSKSTPKKRRKK
jgi:hypothetical protein